MPKEKDLVGQLTKAGQAGIDAFGRLDAATRKFQKSGRRGSIIKSAQGNVFEFPVFISNSVTLDYATATTSLLEQIYASYLQFAISINPIVDAKTVKNGLQFANFKTDTNKYLEYTDMSYAHDACHAVYEENGYVFEFNMVSIEDSDARLINEAMDYQPLSEFEHFFQEQQRITIDDEMDDVYKNSIPELRASSLFTMIPIPEINSDGKFKMVKINGEDVISFEINNDGDLKYETIDHVRHILSKNGVKPAEMTNAFTQIYNSLKARNSTIITSAQLTKIAESAYGPTLERLMTLDKAHRNDPGINEQLEKLDKSFIGAKSAILSAWAMKDIESLKNHGTIYSQMLENIKIKLAWNIKLNDDEKKMFKEMGKDGQRKVARVAQAEMQSIISKAKQDETASLIAQYKNGKLTGKDLEKFKKNHAFLYKALKNEEIGFDKNIYQTIDAKLKVGGKLTDEEKALIDSNEYERMKNDIHIRQDLNKSNLELNKDRIQLNKFDILDKKINKGIAQISGDKIIGLTNEEIITLGGEDNVKTLIEIQNLQNDIVKYNHDKLQREAEKAQSKYYKAADAIQTGANTAYTVMKTADLTMAVLRGAITFKTDVKSKKEDLKQRVLKNEELRLKNQELKKKLETMDEDRRFDKKIKMQQVLTQNAVKAPSFIDESKINKLNTMKPLMMNVTINAVSNNGLIQPMNYIVGVKVRNHLIPADILPEVAMYPLKEMDRISRKVKWRAGELKFFKDLVFRIDQKKQTAVDSRDPRRKWYRRLYELAHMKGDAPASSIIQGKSLFATFLREKIGKRDMMHGLIPNATIIMSQNDVNNIKGRTTIDLLNASTARNFCGELFLISLIIIDTDAESIKIMHPDLHNDFEIHSIASVNKQLATLDTSGSKTRDMFKLLGR